MSLDGDIALIKRVPLFADLPTEQLRLIAFSAVRLELVAGQVLFREGARAQSGYVVSSGRVDLTVGEPGEDRQPVACDAGTLIGEIALFVETRRPATATAAVASQVIEIDRKLITRMLTEYPQAAVRMRATLSERLSATVFDLGKVRQALARIDQVAASGRR
ncbi:MAG TPA: cyclic nucleotide-binding domain-containing protein [Bauldia sp.]|nr:cyclic nucleotide-binding domain-containing protein [Bauldia sp.]